MITETSKHPIPGISHSALLRAAQLAESDTRIGRFYSDEDIEMIRLHLVETGLMFKAVSPTLLVASMIDALAAKELIIWDLQSQVESLKNEDKSNA